MTPERIRSLVDAKLADLGGLIEGRPERCREALQGWLGGRRLSVYADDEKGFRVEGLIRLRLETRAARGEGLRAALEDGSGGRLRNTRPRPPRRRVRPSAGGLNI